MTLSVATNIHLDTVCFRLHLKKGRETYHLLPDGTRDGEYKEHWDDKKIKSKCFYSLGKLCGTKYEWSFEGVLLRVSEFLDDVKHGTFRFWDEQGRPLCEQIFEHGVIVQEKNWYPNGSKRSERNRDSEKVWDVYGETFEFVNGTGKTFTWFPGSDKVSSWSEWKDGKRHGLSVFLREDGTFYCIKRYFEGKLLNNNYYGKR